MLVIQHLLIPRFGRLTSIEKKTARRNEFDSVTHLISCVHEDVVYWRFSVVVVFITLVRRVANHRVEFLIHGTCLAFHHLELEGLVLLPVVYDAEGHRLAGLLFPFFFSCIVEGRFV